MDAFKQRYEGYVVIGYGHDIIGIPVLKLPNRFHRFMLRYFFGMRFQNQDRKLIK